jgi:mannose-6-phosphate isomerase-like protein (cupin superfamily)
MNKQEIKTEDQPNPLRLAELLSESWFPKVVAQFDQHYIKVARLEGTLVWHSHQHEDEVFFVLQGSLLILYEDYQVELHTGDLHVVPKGVRHKPVAEEVCLVMLIENKSTRHTGDSDIPATRSIKDQLSSFDP